MIIKVEVVTIIETTKDTYYRGIFIQQGDDREIETTARYMTALEAKQVASYDNRVFIAVLKYTK